MTTMLGHIVVNSDKANVFHSGPIEDCIVCRPPDTRPVNDVLDDIVKKLQGIRDQLHDVLRNFPE